jgi:hypothetical protein
MRYTKLALLIFGAGMLLGLAVVSANLSGLGRIASLTMAAGIMLVPVALIADLRRRQPKPKPKARSSRTRGRTASSTRRGPPKRRQPRKRS